MTDEKLIKLALATILDNQARIMVNQIWSVPIGNSRDILEDKSIPAIQNCRTLVEYLDPDFERKKLKP